MDFRCSSRLPTSIADAVRRALDSTPPPAGRSVDVKLDEQVRGLADLSRLDQVLVNLLTNAYRYGGTSITIEAASSSDSCSLTVSDDGDGVPANVAEHIFEPFTRGWNTSGAQGSGLGLAICQRLIEAFGGTITYEAATPHGAHFRVSLPLAE